MSWEILPNSFSKNKKIIDVKDHLTILSIVHIQINTGILLGSQFKKIKNKNAMQHSDWRILFKILFRIISHYCYFTLLKQL